VDRLEWPEIIRGFFDNLLGGDCQVDRRRLQVELEHEARIELQQVGQLDVSLDTVLHGVAKMKRNE